MATPTQQDLTQVSAVIDAMVALMGATYTSSNASVSTGTSSGIPGSNAGNSATVGVKDKYGSGYTITSYVAGPVVAVTPLGASLGPAETQQFTAVVTLSGVPVAAPVVTFVATGGLGTITPEGLYTAPATIAANAFDSITCTDTASGSTCSIGVNLHP